MSRIAYVNGRYLPHRAAAVHVEDRGYQFSDGVYEVCEVRGARVIDQRRHLARLRRSLDELRIDMPMSEAALAIVLRECMRRHGISDFPDPRQTADGTYGWTDLNQLRQLVRGDTGVGSTESARSGGAGSAGAGAGKIRIGT